MASYILNPALTSVVMSIYGIKETGRPTEVCILLLHQIVFEKSTLTVCYPPRKLPHIDRCRTDTRDIPSELTSYDEC